MLDLDFFKNINDNYGHACGDEVLVSITGIIKKELREHDLLGRMGGEEFAILLPNTNQTSALLIAEHIREAIENIQLEYKTRLITVTASIGIALDQHANKNLEDMFLAADKLLYQAKEEGRNKVII